MTDGAVPPVVAHTGVAACATLTPMPTRRAVLTVALVALAGCSSSQTPAAPTRDPGQVLAAAASKLASTPGVQADLRTNNLPAGTSGLLDAKGVVTSAPAFDGTLGVVIGGARVEVPVISVGGKVHAKLPLTTAWSVIDPAAYGAPDPATFLTASAGFASLLTAATAVTKGASVRGGTDNSETLTEYRGTVPGAAMKKVLPMAAGDSFAMTAAVTEADELRTASFTGVFYAGAPEMTYTVTFTGYGSTRQITAP